MSIAAHQTMNSHITRSAATAASGSRAAAPRRAHSIETADLLHRYLVDVVRVPLLSERDEREFALRYRDTRDPALAHKLVAANRLHAFLDERRVLEAS